MANTRKLNGTAQKNQPKPLVPHVEYGEYGRAIVVTRLPAEASEAEKNEAIKKAKAIAKQLSHTGWDI